MSSTADLTNVIRHLRIPTANGPGNPELLDRYAREHDQAAFATLVQRYWPRVVYGTGALPRARSGSG
jgi:hypothetical protein